MLRKWLTKKLSIHDDDPVVKEFRKKSYARRHTVDVDSFRMTSSTLPVAPSGSGGEEQTDQEMMAAALAKHSKSYEDQRVGGGGGGGGGGGAVYRRHKSVNSPLNRAPSPSASASASASSSSANVAGAGLTPTPEQQPTPQPTLPTTQQPLLQLVLPRSRGGGRGGGSVRRSASAGLRRPRLTTVPSTDCPPGAEESGPDEEQGEKEEAVETPESSTDPPSVGPGCGGEDDGKLEEADAEGGLAAEVKEMRSNVEEGAEGGRGGGGVGARAKTGSRGGGGAGGKRGGGARSGGRGSQRFRKAGQSKVGGGGGACSGSPSSTASSSSSSASPVSCSGSFKRRSLLRRGMAATAAASASNRSNGVKVVDTNEPLVFPTTPETILEYHKQKPILDENEEWLVVELNEFECLVDSIDVLRIIAKHSKFFEVSPDELWEEFFEFVDTVPSYDEVINFDVWQEFRDKKYTC